jgi:hypothetical protein
MRLPTRLLLPLLCLWPCAAQQHRFTLIDGSQLTARFERIAGAGREANLILLEGQERRTLPLRRLLGWHGPAPAADLRPPARARLVGGQELRGELTGGDAAGESFTMRSTSLGDVRVPIDRMQAILFERQAQGVELEDLALPAGASQDEALFRRAGRGLDVLVGEIEAFQPQGIEFAWGDAAEPKLHRYADLVGIALRGGAQPEQALPFVLITRSGDRLRVELDGGTAEHLELRWEGGTRLRLPLGELAAIAPLGAGARFLSDLPIENAEQSDGFESIGDAGPALFPYQLDRSAGGGYLSSEGWCHAKGIGTHATARLSWRVPDGATHLFALVAFSEEPLLGDVRGDVDVRILQDGEPLFAEARLRAGRPALPTGLLAVKPGAKITLEVNAGRGLAIGDRVNWLSAAFLP